MLTTPDKARLSDREMRDFDKEARALVHDFHDAGWRSHMSNRRHAIMLAPDGKTTANISRNSLRGRSGRNARAALKNWQRKTKPSTHEKTNYLEEEPMVTKHTCPDCPGKQFATSGAYALHRQRKHDGLTCPDCHLLFPANLPPEVYRKHRAEVHGHAPRPRQAKSLRRTLPKKTGSNPKKAVTVAEMDQVLGRICRICKKTFPHKNALNGHMRSHKAKGETEENYVPEPSSDGLSYEAASDVLSYEAARGEDAERDSGRAAVPGPPVAIEGVAHPFTAEAEVPTNGKAKELEPLPGSGIDVRDLAQPDLTDWIAGQDPAGLLTTVLATIAPPLVGEIERLRRQNADLTEQVGKLQREALEFEARMELVREAMGA